MIPKIIHYCWLSNEPLPQKIQDYISHWKQVMPDYVIKKWDTTNFDISTSKWVSDAFAKKKWAFCADYIRAYALFTEGGYYLDSDVIVNENFDRFLNCGFVSSIEYFSKFKTEIQKSVNPDFSRNPNYTQVYGLGIQAAIIGSEKGHFFPGLLLDYYKNNSFIKEDGSLNLLPAPAIYSLLLEKYGFKYKDEKQVLNNDIHIFDSSVFASYPSCTFSSVAIHMMAGSWVDVKPTDSFFEKIKKSILVRKVLNSLNFFN